MKPAGKTCYRLPGRASDPREWRAGGAHWRNGCHATLRCCDCAAAAAVGRVAGLCRLSILSTLAGMSMFSPAPVRVGIVSMAMSEGATYDVGC